MSRKEGVSLQVDSISRREGVLMRMLLSSCLVKGFRLVGGFLVQGGCVLNSMWEQQGSSGNSWKESEGFHVLQVFEELWRISFWLISFTFPSTTSGIVL